MVDAVIFDMDGLLIDSEIISFAIYRNLLEPFGHDFTKEVYAEHYSGRTEEANVERLVETYQLPWTFDQALANVYAEEKRLIANGVALKTGARELLAYLHQNAYPIALATSSLKERAMNILGQHDLLPYFDQMVFGVEVKKSKPAPDIFLKACEKLSVSPQNVLILEDSESGLRSALAAGAQVICVPDMKRPSQVVLDQTLLVAESLLDVLSFLENQEQQH